MRGRAELERALRDILSEMDLPFPEKLVIAEPKNREHGDMAINAALLLAKEAKRNPLDLAAVFAQKIRESCPSVASAEAARPGFVNVRFTPAFWQAEIPLAEREGANFGKSKIGGGEKVLVEYVSANPTGPLHVGHGRGAAVGDAMARILAAAGYDVSAEYYLNDAGRQMETLGRSILLRARELSGEAVDFPKDCYQGAYVRDIAADLLRRRPDLLSLPEAEALDACKAYGMEEILKGIKQDLADFRCRHDRFFSEKSLVESGATGAALAALAKSGRSFERDGALWFESVSLGDDQNRVLRKSDGSLTYFAADIAYHHDKFRRGHQWLVDVWGADHHGYIPRMRAAVVDMGEKPEKLSVMLIQLVKLIKDAQVAAMSTRAGEFVELREVIDSVGVDAARFIFLSRSCDSQLDFDLDLATRRALDNPVYYVQYAHARVRSLLRRAKERGLDLPEISGAASLAPLDTPEDLAILRWLDAYEDTLISAAQTLAPHLIARWLEEMAGRVHGYYARHTVLDEANPAATLARLALLRAAGQAIANGLDLLGVSAPESM